MNPKDAAASEIELNQVIHLRREIKRLSAEMQKLRAQLGNQELFMQSVADAIVAANDLPPFQYKKGQKSKTPVDVVIKLSDWHIGEVIQPDETEGFGKFNWHIAQERVYQIVNDFLNWVNLQRHVYPIENCALFCEGDYISGDIHPELTVTNEFPLPVQTANAGLLLAEVVRILASQFGRVDVHCIGADNHGRLMKKPQTKQKTTNNMNYLVYAVTEAKVEKLSRVRLLRATGSKHVVSVNGWRFLVEHGDGIRGWAGVPWYGIERLFGKEAKRRMNTTHGFHYWSFGHFHVPMAIEWKTFVNGSLSGTSEFDHANGRHSKPGQMAFLVHAEQGLMSPMVFWGR